PYRSRIPALLCSDRGLIVWGILSEAHSEYESNHLSAAEHLRLAQEACRTNVFNALCVDPSGAIPHLNKIPHDAAEYSEAHKLLQMIQLQEQTAAEHSHSYRSFGLRVEGQHAPHRGAP